MTPTWPAALAEFVLLLAPDDLPAVPFPLGQSATVTDRAAFLRALQADVRRGPNGPRAMYGAIQTDLQAVREILLPDCDQRTEAAA